MWNPYLAKNIDKLEKAQWFTLRLCFKERDLDYRSLLFLSDLLNAARQKYFNQCTIIICVNRRIYHILVVQWVYRIQNTFVEDVYAKCCLSFVFGIHSI